MTRPKQPAGLRKLFSPPPDKKFLRIWNKNFITEIYRNIQTFAFQMFWECSSWAFRNSAGQMFFLTHTRDMFVGKLVNWLRFSAVLQKYFFYNVEWVEIQKMSEFFERNYLEKWVIFFANFSWLWDTLPENLKLIDAVNSK